MLGCVWRRASSSLAVADSGFFTAAVRRVLAGPHLDIQALEAAVETCNPDDASHFEALMGVHNAAHAKGMLATVPSTHLFLTACAKYGEVDAAIGIAHDGLAGGMRGYREIGAALAGMCHTVDQVYHVYAMLQTVVRVAPVPLEDAAPLLLELCVDGGNADLARRVVQLGGVDNGAVLEALKGVVVDGGGPVYCPMPAVVAAACPGAGDGATCPLAARFPAPKPQAAGVLAEACSCCRSCGDGGTGRRVAGLLGIGVDDIGPAPGGVLLSPSGLRAAVRTLLWSAVGGGGLPPLDRATALLTSHAAAGVDVGPSLAAVAYAVVGTTRGAGAQDAMRLFRRVRTARAGVHDLEVGVWGVSGLLPSARAAVEAAVMLKTGVREAAVLEGSDGVAPQGGVRDVLALPGGSVVPKLPPRAPPAVEFVAVFLSQESRDALLEAVPPVHRTVVADHVTLALRPSEQELAGLKASIGRRVALKVVSIAADDGVQAVAVELPPGVLSTSSTPYVTVSLAAGRKAVESNGVLDSGWTALPTPVQLTGSIAAACPMDGALRLVSAPAALAGTTGGWSPFDAEDAGLMDHACGLDAPFSVPELWPAWAAVSQAVRESGERSQSGDVVAAVRRSPAASGVFDLWMAVCAASPFAGVKHDAVVAHAALCEEHPDVVSPVASHLAVLCAKAAGRGDAVPVDVDAFGDDSALPDVLQAACAAHWRAVAAGEPPAPNVAACEAALQSLCRRDPAPAGTAAALNAFVGVAVHAGDLRGGLQAVVGVRRCGGSPSPDAIGRLLRMCAEVGDGPAAVALLADVVTGGPAYPLHAAMVADAVLAAAKFMRAPGGGANSGDLKVLLAAVRRRAPAALASKLRCLQEVPRLTPDAVVDDAVVFVDVMGERGVGLTTDVYSAVIQLCSACGNSQSGLAFYKAFLREPLTAHAGLFEAMVGCACDAALATLDPDTEHKEAKEWAAVAFKAVHDMRALGVAPTVALCGDLTRVAAATDDADGMREVIRVMKAGGLLQS